MNSFIAWIGGKRFLRKEIISHFPNNIGRYIEVFGGAGWVLFGNDSKHAEMEVFNDINGDFINECKIKIVWSPVSNLLLYDDTPKYLMSKINPELLCLGSDWAPSGSKHIWDEAKFAQDFSVRYFYNTSVPQNINDIFLDMISYIPAKAIGSERIGEIAVGKYADFYIVSKNRKIPKQNI